LVTNRPAACNCLTRRPQLALTGNTTHLAEKFQSGKADSSSFRDYILADAGLDAGRIEFAKEEAELDTPADFTNLIQPNWQVAESGHLGCARRAIASLVFPRSKT
jgi:hypothetical protein